VFDSLLRLPPFNLRLRSPFASVARHMDDFYSDYPRPAADSFIDLDIRIEPGRGLRRYWHRQARFVVNDLDPFFPLPADQAPPLLEWGLNWSIASQTLGYLVIHAAVLARHDRRALVIPGFPGAGKSTLCASLAFLRDWRLLSDELAILDPESGELVPNPRPISVKNDSIAIVSGFPGARAGPRYRDTRKGDISLVAPSAASIAAAEVSAECGWIVFPQFRTGAEPSIEAMPKAEAFALISEQSFNKERLGATGFQALCSMIDGAACYSIEYGSTVDGLALIDQLCSRLD
jgi:hypothetical protein